MILCSYDLWILFFSLVAHRWPSSLVFKQLGRCSISIVSLIISLCKQSTCEIILVQFCVTSCCFCVRHCWVFSSLFNCSTTANLTIYFVHLTTPGVNGINIFLQQIVSCRFTVVYCRVFDFCLITLVICGRGDMATRSKLDCWIQQPGAILFGRYLNALLWHWEKSGRCCIPLNWVWTSTWSCGI